MRLTPHNAAALKNGMLASRSRYGRSDAPHQKPELMMRYRGHNKVCTATFELRLDSDFFMAPSGS